VLKKIFKDTMRQQTLIEDLEALFANFFWQRDASVNNILHPDLGCSPQRLKIGRMICSIQYLQVTTSSIFVV